MTAGEVASILRAIGALEDHVENIDARLDGFKDSLDEVKVRLSTREHADLEARARAAGRMDVVRWGLALYRSDMARWVAVGVAVFLGTR